MKGLTARQKEILSFISGFIDRHRFPPTLREISEAFKFSVKGAHDHVRALEKKEILRYRARSSRTLEIIDRSVLAGSEEEEVRRLPIVGKVAAGMPIFADENIEGYLGISRHNLKNDDYFVLRVEGSSMIEAGILDGDLAVIARRNTASDGDIVVALINDEKATLKRFFREKTRVRLEPANSDPAYKTIYGRNVHILGRLAYILRSYE
ncbi:MAG: transcriptional repressor LexA [Spirochaetales bacterium]|jgi:repressor LexA|nr:transcriptional repressor LexA [Spirochaetales bacterium]